MSGPPTDGTEPSPSPDLVALHGRRAVRAFARELGPRRVSATRVHVGTPAREEVAFAGEDGYDDGLRVDLLVRALDAWSRDVPPIVWLTRSGQLEPVATDLRWYSAARRAQAHHGLDVAPFLLVNRRAWVDLVSGAGFAWRRVRWAPPPSAR